MAEPLSLWLDLAPPVRRAALPGDRQVDVAIVGGGFTGLWTALYLARRDPSLRIAVLEREFTGFGASGRNGGWCSDLFPASAAKLARAHGRDAALAMRRAVRGSIDEIQTQLTDWNADCGFHRGGTLGLARSKAQLERARDEVATARKWGESEADLRLLDAAETAEMISAADVLGATFTPHCAVLDPGRLVRALASQVEAAGATIFEDTPVTAIEPGRVLTARGRVRADIIIRATEAYTAGLAGFRRAVAPVYSLITATEPLSAEQLAAVGLADRPSFADHRHLVCYGQRTADGRIVFGGRGAPYHFASRTKAAFDRDPAVFAALRTALVQLLPALAGVRFSHTWGGPVGVARDWHPSVGFSPETGLGWAGGYLGDGVSTTNLAGRTLADLITGTDSALTALPWVGHVSPRWEVEPLRWLGINAGLRVTIAADRAEARSGRPSRLAQAFGRFTGG